MRFSSTLILNFFPLNSIHFIWSKRQPDTKKLWIVPIRWSVESLYVYSEYAERLHKYAEHAQKSHFFQRAYAERISAYTQYSLEEIELSGNLSFQ